MLHLSNNAARFIFLVLEFQHKYSTLNLIIKVISLIDIAEFREIPTYKRMCLCILRNDYACKYMGFAVSKEEKKMKDYILQQYKKIWT